MKLATNLAVMLSLAAVLYACNDAKPKIPNVALVNPLATSSPARIINGSRAQCADEKMILTSKAGAHFTWEANKTADSESTTEVPVVGTTQLFGLIVPKFRVKDGLEVPSLAGAKAQIDFLPETTQSFNRVRDARIIQYIFGHDLSDNPEGSIDNNASTGLLSFVMDAVTGDDIDIPIGAGNAISVKVIGTLWIAGFEVPLQVPMTLTKTDTGYNMLNSAPFSINIRGGAPSVNTFGLDKRVAEILALVAPVAMRDQVELSFDIDLVDICQ